MFRLFFSIISLLILFTKPIDLYAQDATNSELKINTQSEKSVEPNKETDLKSKFPFLYEDENPVKKSDDDSFTDALHHMLFTLGILVAFMLFVSWVLKRLTAKKSEQINASSSIKVLDQRQLSHKTTVYTIAIQDKILAIAESPTATTLLADLTPKEIRHFDKVDFDN